MRMAKLSETGIHCGACSGICCTFRANSMQITPSEALDMKKWLQSAGRWDGELKARLQSNIREFGLDRPRLGNGSQSFSRRRYTCPFFAGSHLGCTMDAAHKPYGCLAFNPEIPGVSQGGHCSSDQALLMEREERNGAENEANLRLVRRWKWPEDKLPIPEALLLLFQQDV